MSSEGELGNLGEPAVSLSHARIGGPGDQKPWRGRGASTLATSPAGRPRTTEAGKVSGNERQVKDPEMGRVAVVAAHSTEEGGEVRPTGPTGGKAPSSRVSHGRE